MACCRGSTPRCSRRSTPTRTPGRPTFIVSAAGDELVQLLARILYMDGGIGTAYEVGEDGLFTGELGGTFMYGEGKVEAMRRFADELDIDLAASYAYSDSASDLPMLRAVGHPVVVNPDEPLARIAREEGWRVMRFERLGRQLALGRAHHHDPCRRRPRPQ